MVIANCSLEAPLSSVVVVVVVVVVDDDVTNEIINTNLKYYKHHLGFECASHSPEPFTLSPRSP